MFTKLRELFVKAGDNKSDYFTSQKKVVLEYRLEIMLLKISSLIRLRKLKRKCCCQYTWQKTASKNRIAIVGLNISETIKQVLNFFYLKPNEKNIGSFT